MGWGVFRVQQPNAVFEQMILTLRILVGVTEKKMVVSPSRSSIIQFVMSMLLHIIKKTQKNIAVS